MYNIWMNGFDWLTNFVLEVSITLKIDAATKSTTSDIADKLPWIQYHEVHCNIKSSNDNNSILSVIL